MECLFGVYGLVFEFDLLEFALAGGWLILFSVLGCLIFITVFAFVLDSCVFALTIFV